MALYSDELKQLEEIFNRFDMNHDGSLTQLEVAALLRSLGICPTGDQITLMLASKDANGNGAIEFDELVEVLLPEMDQQFMVDQDRLLKVFQSFDRDGNGYITLVELAAKMAQMKQPLTYHELTEMMKEADENGDGMISFTEFANILALSAAEFFPEC